MKYLIQSEYIDVLIRKRIKPGEIIEVDISRASVLDTAGIGCRLEESKPVETATLPPAPETAVLPNKKRKIK